jgi:ribosomal-protein-alanine N-acetyltransferase
MPVFPYIYEDNLESERLITRFLTADDANIWSHFFNDTIGTRFLITGSPMDPLERAQSWMAKQLARYRNSEFGMQALIDKKSGAFVGQCGLLEQEVNGKLEVEIGYHLFKEHRHAGYATEAAVLFKNYGFQNLQVESLISLIHPENVDSQAVAKRNGMTQTDCIHKWDLDILIFRIQRNEWLQGM